jgi:hypothetical protein
MSIIKEIIKFNNLDLNLKFSLDSGMSLTGYQQEINNSTIDTEDELINPVNDIEVRRFNSTIQNNLSFYFHLDNAINEITNNVDSNSFINAGFIQDEIDFNRDTIRNSFFILDFYDSYNPNTQTKIFTTYLTKILANNNTANYLVGTSPLINLLGIKNQFNYWYIPQSYINSFNLYASGYIKFSFYNAKFGKIQLFYNRDNQALKTPEKLYFKAILNLISKTWSFSTASSPNINAYELYNSSAYTNRINNTAPDFNNLKQNYPTGNTFISTNGSYVTE